MAFNAGGRPPIRPRARLAASAVRVRSRRSSTSNCPRAAKMWRISRPVALVVSMFSCSDRRPMPRAVEASPPWSKAGAGIAPVGRAGQRPAHHPRGRTPRRRQAVGDPFGCRSSVPRTPVRTRQHEGRRSGRRWFADRSRREHSPPTSEVSQNSSYPRAIGTRVSGLSSGTPHGWFQDVIRTNLWSCRKRSFLGSRALLYNPCPAADHRHWPDG
jgi:hypothetical protein